MKFILNLLMVVIILSVISCEKVSQDAVKLSVDYTWEGLEECDFGNPEIRFSGVPEKTKYIKIEMYDHAHWQDHGKVTAPYTGTIRNGIIEKNKFKEIEGPCPYTSIPKQVEVTVKALDENKDVIGVGSKEKFYPEKEINKGKIVAK